MKVAASLGAAPLSLALLAGSGPIGAIDCGRALDPTTRVELAGAELQLAFAPQPAPMRLGQHFALEIEVCMAAGQPAATQLRVDADMPAHRHGMNYATRVEPLGNGRYRATGLLLHMPGRWRLLFDLQTAAGARRLTHEWELDP